MAMGRYVLLLLGSRDVDWIESVRRRVAAAARPAELVLCEHPHEACARLASGRLHSAVLVNDAGTIDSHLADAAAAAGTPLVAWGRNPGELTSIPRIPRGDRLPEWVAELLGTASSSPGQQGRVVGVCGPGGTGASVVAMAVAQGLGPSEDLLLADFARRSHQALLHDMSDGAAGLLDLIAGLRGRCPSSRQVRAGTLAVDGQPYRLLPGPPRSHHWTAVHPRSFDMALQALRAAFGLLIADVTADFEGEAETGSLEIEERNHAARRVAVTADVVILVGGPGRTTRHATTDTRNRLVALGVDESRILTCANRVSPGDHGVLEHGALRLPEVALAGYGPLPPTLVIPLREAARAALGDLPPRRSGTGLLPVPPGTVGFRGETV